MSRAEPLVQRFPRREGDRITHRQWVVDLAAAAGLCPWARRRAASGGGARRLEREVAEMAEHFPRWILTLAAGRRRLTCRACGGMLVFDRGVRCAACERAASTRQLERGAGLAWFGLLPPVGIDSLTRLRDELIARPPAAHLVGRREGIGHYLLVPLLALYPPTFPQRPVDVAYLPAFFTIRGLPPERPAHAYHMLGDGFMCLFAPGQWRQDTTCREVLQQRAYAHVIKLLNYGNGKQDAFAVVS